MRVEVKPKLLRWARERARLNMDMLEHRFPQMMAWERQESHPTLRQLENLAKALHVPVGYLFLPEPPEEPLPIPDFRTVGGKAVERPSPDLLDTLYVCQQRQEWYRGFVNSLGEEELTFPGSIKKNTDIRKAADLIRHALGFDIEQRRRFPTWEIALSHFVDQADELGILVMRNGVVQNNNKRKLDPDEFRGFAMVDPFAPLIFINGADTKSAQMFTLAHELAHVWAGESALSNSEAAHLPDNEVERWCNEVAAELLVPLDAIKNDFSNQQNLTSEITRLARRFKVSTLVILRRLHDAGHLGQKQLWAAYNQEVERLKAIPRGSGGDFYLTQGSRVGKRFAKALVASTLEGNTLYQDAFKMLGFFKLETFKELGRSLGVMA